MRSFLLKKTDLLWWLGIIAFWFMGRFILALPKFIKNWILPQLHDYYNYLIEGLIASSSAMIIVVFIRKLTEKDEIKEKKVFGVKFVWHKKYIWHWIGITIWWGIGQSLIKLYYHIPPDIIWNFIKGGFFIAIAILGAGLWEGNPGFFEGPSRRKDEEK